MTVITWRKNNTVYIYSGDSFISVNVADEKLRTRNHAQVLHTLKQDGVVFQDGVAYTPVALVDGDGEGVVERLRCDLLWNLHLAGRLSRLELLPCG